MDDEEETIANLAKGGFTGLISNTIREWILSLTPLGGLHRMITSLRNMPQEDIKKLANDFVFISELVSQNDDFMNHITQAAMQNDEEFHRFSSPGSIRSVERKLAFAFRDISEKMLIAVEARSGINTNFARFIQEILQSSQRENNTLQNLFQCLFF